MSTEWPAPDFWCTICDRGAEGCTHTPADVLVVSPREGTQHG